MGVWSLANKSDEELLAGIDCAEVAQQVLVLEQELIRRGLLKLNESSERLERSTRRLTWLTVVLILLTVILAVPECRRLVSWLTGH